MLKKTLLLLSFLFGIWITGFAQYPTAPVINVANTTVNAGVPFTMYEPAYNPTQGPALSLQKQEFINGQWETGWHIVNMGQITQDPSTKVFSWQVTPNCNTRYQTYGGSAPNTFYSNIIQITVNPIFLSLSALPPGEVLCVGSTFSIYLGSYGGFTPDNSIVLQKYEGAGTPTSWTTINTPMLQSGSSYYWSVTLNANTQYRISKTVAGTVYNSTDNSTAPLSVKLWQPQLLVNGVAGTYVALQGDLVNLSLNMNGASSTIGASDAVTMTWSQNLNPINANSPYSYSYSYTFYGATPDTWKVIFTATNGCAMPSIEYVAPKPFITINSSTANSYITNGTNVIINVTFSGANAAGLLLQESDYSGTSWSPWKSVSPSIPIAYDGVNYYFNYQINNTTRFQVLGSNTSDGTSITSNTLQINSINTNIAPTPSIVNYIRNTVLQTPLSDFTQMYTLSVSGALQTTTYFDGLGRPIQQVVKQGNPEKVDMSQITEYDAFGREAKHYLPYPSGVSGYFDLNAVQNEFTYYQFKPTVAHDANPYSISVFEPTPLNRVAEQGAPGLAWQPTDQSGNSAGKTVKLAYNQDMGNEGVRLWNYDYSTGLCTSSSAYTGYVLYKTQTTDEHGNLSWDYQDFEGKTVYKKAQDVAGSATITGASFIETYYVYDDFGKLRIVIPPMGVQTLKTANSWAVTQTFLDTWCFQYQYDERQRMVAKKVPGAGWQYLVYDQRDRLILTQDANQRVNNNWSFVRYDVLNRPVCTGIVTMNTAKSQALTQADVYAGMTSQGFYSSRISTSALTGYDDISYPNSTSTNVASIEWLTSTFYDDYSFKSETQWSATATTAYDFVAELGLATPISSLKGKVTGTKVKVLGENTWLKTVSYYDNKYRVTQSIADNYTALGSGGIDRVSNQYDFTGRVLQTQLTHTGIENVTVLQEHGYDHVGRIIDVYHTVNGGQRTRLTHYLYNTIGQLIDKQLHSTAYPCSGIAITLNSYNSSYSSVTASQSITFGTGFSYVATATAPFTATLNTALGTALNTCAGSYLQSVDYRYNIRGWLTSINNSTLTSDLGLTNDDNNDLWGMELKYEAPVTGGTAQYNGNISEVIWSRKDFGTNAITQNPWGSQYTYDPLSRLKTTVSTRKSGTTWGLDTKYNETFGFDKNGNMTGLTRQGVVSGTTTQIDNLSYNTYTGNQVTKIDDASGNTLGFTDGSAASIEYLYDGNGNMTSDYNSGITISYNMLNLPQSITKGSITTSYKYDASGRKVYKSNPTNSTYYMGALQFQQSNGSEQLYFLSTSEGRVRKNGTWTAYEYFIKDHLGDVRVSFDKNTTTTGNAEIIQANAYYSFGSSLVDNSTGTDAVGYVASLKNSYLYNGKEIQVETGYYDYGWRQFDPIVGRWWVVDQFSEKYHVTSPYAFVQNNPILHREVDGRYFDKKNENKAQKFERKIEQKTIKLHKELNNLVSQGKKTGDLLGRMSQLAKSKQDISDMRSNQKTEFRYAKAKDNQPTTKETGTNQVTMSVSNNMGSVLHEGTHGGQMARGELGNKYENYGVNDEVSAYKSQYAYDGKFEYFTNEIPSQQVMMQRIGEGKNPLTNTIMDINQITPKVINSISENGSPLYPPSGVSKAQWNSN